jgi:hypothetical protein
MKRTCDMRVLRAAAMLCAVLLAVAVPLSAQPKITLSNDATSMAIWYLGPGQTGIVPNGYYTEQGQRALIQPTAIRPLTSNGARTSPRSFSWLITYFLRARHTSLPRL